MHSERLRRAAPNIALAAAATILALGAAEAALRLNPRLAGQTFADGIGSKYRVSAEGIYYEHPDFPLTRLMKPEFETQMSFKGYSWKHRADRYGFRNMEERSRADVVLLGDSFIYGHGLELDQTVGRHLELRTGLAVINMARQGDSILQQVCLLNAFIGTFRPRYVVHFFFQNDIPDIKGKLISDDMMRRVLDAPEGEPPCKREPYATPPAPIYPDPPPDRRLYLVRLWYGRRPLKSVVYEWSLKLFNRPYKYPPNAHEESLEWKIMRRGLRQLDAIAKRNGAELILAPIGTADEPTYVRHLEIFRKVAQDEGLNLLDTTSLDRARPELVLPRDGHFSAKGAEAMADIVSRALVRAR